MIGGRYSELFNKSLRLGCLPEDWKLANIGLVFKKDSKEKAESYRPISLLSIVLKSWRGAYSMLLVTMFSILSAHASMAS